MMLVIKIVMGAIGSDFNLTGFLVNMLRVSHSSVFNFLKNYKYTENVCNQMFLNKFNFGAVDAYGKMVGY